MTRGFTLIELLISVSIFIIMTSLVVAKYGTFNQSALLTDTAYDIALTLRQAQTYGLSVRNYDVNDPSANQSVVFSVPYGIDFNKKDPGAPGSNTCVGGESNNTQIVLFADTSPAGAPNDVYNLPGNGCDLSVVNYKLTRGVKIQDFCAGTGSSCNTFNLDTLDITFQRPNPEAIIVANALGPNSCQGGVPCTYAEITLMGSDGSARKIVVRQNGQISIKQ